jgi:hypothetical protein
MAFKRKSLEICDLFSKCVGRAHPYLAAKDEWETQTRSGPQGKRANGTPRIAASVSRRRRFDIADSSARSPGRWAIVDGNFQLANNALVH